MAKPGRPSTPPLPDGLTAELDRIGRDALTARAAAEAGAPAAHANIVDGLGRVRWFTNLFGPKAPQTMEAVHAARLQGFDWPWIAIAQNLDWDQAGTASLAYRRWCKRTGRSPADKGGGGRDDSAS